MSDAWVVLHLKEKMTQQSSLVDLNHTVPDLQFQKSHWSNGTHHRDNKTTVNREEQLSPDTVIIRKLRIQLSG